MDTATSTGVACVAAAGLVVSAMVAGNPRRAGLASQTSRLPRLSEAPSSINVSEPKQRGPTRTTTKDLLVDRPQAKSCQQSPQHTLGTRDCGQHSIGGGDHRSSSVEAAVASSPAIRSDSARGDTAEGGQHATPLSRPSPTREARRSTRDSVESVGSSRRQKSLLFRSVSEDDETRRSTEPAVVRSSAAVEERHCSGLRAGGEQTTRTER